MSDLTERLREMSRRGYWPLLGHEAADEIATLRAQLAAAEARAERLASAVDIVLRRFTEAETAGYRTADRQFAIDILGKAEGDTP